MNQTEQNFITCDKKTKGLRFQFKKNSSKFWIIETKKISYGQIYVALKRVTLLGLHVLGFFSVKAIWTEPQKLAQHNKIKCAERVV